MGQAMLQRTKSRKWLVVLLDGLGQPRAGETFGPFTKANARRWCADRGYTIVREQ